MGALDGVRDSIDALGAVAHKVQGCTGWTIWMQCVRDVLGAGKHSMDAPGTWRHQMHSMAAMPAMAISKTFVEVAPDAH